MTAVQGFNLNASKDPVVDTRTPSPVHPTDSEESTPTSPDYQPDLSAEVAMLSTKLVNAINYQTNLDDSLQQTRHELEMARQRVSELEAEKQRLSNVINGGAYVKRSEMDKTVSNMQAELASARTARERAEKAKKQTDNELENLTVSLFEEANKMVAVARKNTEASEKRNTQLTAQLRDTELLLASQQEQLQDLKGTMEKLQDDALPEPSMPSTPITANAAMFDSLPMSSSALMDMTPEHPLFFTHLLSPVLRNDTAAFADFQELLLLARRLGAHSRSNSSNNNNAANAVSSAGSMSSPNIPGAFSLSTNQSPSSIYGGGSSMSSMPALKDSKFYKRALTEDIEPTLRLDLAPGLSFLSRRSVLSSLLQGTLVVEPYPQNKHYFGCTLCGEQRRKEDYIRRHRFRMSEDDGVSKPLCDYCVSRLRSTCDFVSFLRMVRDGLWRCDNEQDQKIAWEESARLRERMFWSRLGGGVIPRVQQSSHRAASVNGSAVEPASERESLERIPEGTTKTTTASSDADDVPQIKVRVPTATQQQDTSTLRTARPISYVTPPGSSVLSDEDPPTRPATAAGDNANEGGSSSPQFEDASEQLDQELSLAIEEAGAKDITPVAIKSDKPHSRSASRNSTPSSRAASPEKPANRNSTASWSKRASLPVTPAAERNASIPNSSIPTTDPPSSPSHSRSPSQPTSRPPRSPSPLKFSTTTASHTRHASRDSELDAERNRWSKRASVQSVTAAAERERGESVVSVVSATSEGDEEVVNGEGEGEGDGDGEGEGKTGGGGRGGQEGNAGEERTGRLAVGKPGAVEKKKKERKGSSVLERVRAMERS